MDELRAIQLEFMPSHMREAILRNDQPPTPVSPSDHGILSSVEQDAAEDLEDVRLHAAGRGNTSWGQEAGAVFFGDALGPPHESTSIGESNLPSLAITTPASGAPDQTADDVEMALTAAALSGSLEPGLQNSSNDVLETISPSALIAATDPAAISGTSLVDGSSLLAAVNAPVEPQDHDIAMQDHHEYGILLSEDAAENEYIIALPPPARSRPEMAEIVRRHGLEIENFKDLFSQDSAPSLDNKAAVKVDAMLLALNELSNLPPYHKDLANLSQEQWVRYARDTTSKLAFIYEFLDKLRTVDVSITILAAGGPVIEKVEAIVNQGGFSYRLAHQQNWSQESKDPTSLCKVLLMDTSRADSGPKPTENIVIAYDETAESSGLLQPYKRFKPEEQSPLIFSLVGVYSLEHINRRLSPAMDTLERKLAQICCLVTLMEYADDEDAYEQVPQPHEFAEELAKYIVDEDGFHAPPIRWESWDYQRIPEHVFETFKETRALMAPYGTRKRAREDSPDDLGTPKRARIDPAMDDVQLSEGLRQHFGNDVRVTNGLAEVSLEKLEDLIDVVSGAPAAIYLMRGIITDRLQIRDLKAALDKKGEEVKSHVRTIRRFGPKYHEAVGDRGKFESQRDQAFKERERIQKELVRSESRVTNLAADKQQLEAALQALTKSEAPDVAAAAQREIDLKAAQDKAALLERQLKSSQDNGSFARARYQDASDQAAALGEENTELKNQIKNLEVRASDNIVEIRRINAQRAEASLRQMYENERRARLDREREIDRKNEEMRNYKARFGGRETRGSSVPRSPRVRQVNSRNTSPVGDNGTNGGNGNGGVGGSLFGPRGAHLRDL